MVMCVVVTRFKMGRQDKKNRPISRNTNIYFYEVNGRDKCENYWGSRGGKLLYTVWKIVLYSPYFLYKAYKGYVFSSTSSTSLYHTFWQA